MRQLAIAGQMDLDLLATARRIVAAAPVRDYDGYAVQIRRYLEGSFVFIRDPRDVDAIEAPGDLIRSAAQNGVAYGDCDDVATLAAALALAVGFENVRFVIVAFDTEDAPFSHIWTELEGTGRWFDMDVTKPHDTDLAPITRVAVMEV